MKPAAPFQLKHQPAGRVSQRLAGGISLDHLIFYGGIALCLLVTALVILIPVRLNPSGVDASTTISATVSRHLGDFSLINCNGQSVTRSDLNGQFLIVNFVFTGCSLSCLRVNDRMAEIQQLVTNQNDVRLVSLTIDPASDTPQSLARFAARFNADTNRWLFLTGAQSTLHPLIEKTFLGPGKSELRGVVPGGFANTDRIALVDQHGEVRAMFNGLKSSVAREVGDKLAALRKESSQQ